MPVCVCVCFGMWHTFVFCFCPSFFVIFLYTRKCSCVWSPEEYLILRVVSGRSSLFVFAACVLAKGQSFPPHVLLSCNIGLCQSSLSLSTSLFRCHFLFFPSLMYTPVTLSVSRSPISFPLSTSRILLILFPFTSSFVYPVHVSSFSLACCAFRPASGEMSFSLEASIDQASGFSHCFLELSNKSHCYRTERDNKTSKCWENLINNGDIITGYPLIWFTLSITLFSA